MHLHSYCLKNYRRLRDVLVELAPDISIFVGANNSGKTSAAQAIQMFLAGSRFSLFDFSSHLWKSINEVGNGDAAGDAQAQLPCIVLDLWFEVSESDLYLVLPILPSSEWQGNQAGIRIEFGAKSVAELLQRFRGKQREAREGAAVLGDAAGAYIPWPKTLTDYLEKELHREFEFRYYVLDRAQFNAEFMQSEGYSPSPITSHPGGAAIVESLIRVDSLNAQRYLSDPSSPNVSGPGRGEDLSRRLSRFYRRNLEQREADHTALKALFDSEEGLNRHLMAVFEPTLQRIATLGYPGLYNPKLEIKSSLNPANVMSQDAKVHYALGDGVVTLPDSYNGLGFKNLIYMVVELLDLQARWVADEEKRAPLHLIFIEEPESHMHAQLQQVFIRNVLGLLEIAGDVGGVFGSQLVVTTHSPHILYERGFSPIRYFRRHVIDGEQSTQVLNLSGFQRGSVPNDRDFLLRYMKLTHCDLFFADAAILVEGNVERLLMPLMIERSARSLRSAALSILEVGGAFAHRFRGLIEFLGITTLIVTDLDSVIEVASPAEADEDEEKEFEVPGEGASVQRKYGSTCLPSVLGAVTANQTLIQWLPRKRTVAELIAVPELGKSELLRGSEAAMVRVAYQVPTNVEWRGTTTSLCGRTLEEAFGLENATWCQSVTQRFIGLKLKVEPANPSALAEGLHKRVTGKNFDKTKFALGVLSVKESEWAVPLYIREGLLWLKEQIDLEVAQEAEAVTEAVAEGAAVTIDGQVQAP